MNLVKWSIFLLLLPADCILGQPAESTNRIAIYPFRDNAASGPQQIGEKLYDRLVSGFSSSGAYQVIDRQFLNEVIKEQRLPGGLFGDATAVRVGKLLNVPVILFGTVTTFTVNPNASDDATGIYGTVTVAATARIVSTESGAILKAPVANETARGMIRLKPLPPAPQRPCTMILGQRICGPAPAVTAAPRVELKTLEQLLDQAIEACGRSLVTQIMAMPVARTSVATASSPLAKVSVIGVSDGMTYINRGSEAGLKVGQEIRIYRVVQTGLVNPDDRTPVTRKNQICTLTLSDGFSSSGAYQVIDRQFLNEVIKEQRLPGGLFDDATAVRVGKLLNVPVILFGTVTTFTVNPNASDDATGIYGTVTVAATARIVSTESGAILKAPVANETARGMIRLKPLPPAPQRPCTMILGQRICGPAPAVTAAPRVELKTLEQLLDQAIEACGRSLVTQIMAMPVARTSVATASSPLAKVSVIGVSDGMTYINRGSEAGLKVGQEIRIYRVVQTGLVNPDDRTPVTRKNQICTLTLSDVEQRNSGGNCVGGSPLSGDNAEISVQ